MLLGLILAVAAVLFNIFDTSDNEGKNISIPVVKEMIDAKPVVSKSKINQRKDDSKVFNLETIRVSPEGGLVVAGKFFPNSKIEIISKGEVIASTISDKTGEFVIVPKKSLKQGEHILAFKILTPDKKVIIADKALAIRVNENESDVPIVAIIDSDARVGAKVVQAPGLKRKIKNNLNKNNMLPTNLKPEISIMTMTNDINVNQIILTGYAIGGVQVDSGISGKEIFSGKIVDNEWSITIPNQLINGKQKLISALIDKNGKIVARDDLIFEGNIIKDAKGKTVLIVQKGDALWKIAYKRLGGGDKYLDIFKLNASKIIDPHLIFPKQLFILPN